MNITSLSATFDYTFEWSTSQSKHLCTALLDKQSTLTLQLKQTFTNSCFRLSFPSVGVRSLFLVTMSWCRTYFILGLTLVALVQVKAADDNLEYDDDEGRLLVPILVGGTTGLNLNITQIAALAALLSSGLLTALGLAALGILLFSLLWDRDSGYGGSGYGGGGGYSTYSSYRRSYNPYAIDWEKFSIIDWLSIGEEAYRKFDPADLDCQKRLICEIHQNTDRFGAAAAKMVDLFSYLQYAEVLSLPDEFKALVEEYLDAADRGKSLQKECGEVYNACEFSVKKMVDKLNHNEI